MRFRALVCLVSLLVLSACAGSRGGIVDKALDDSLYQADTKAERLLRYFEVQALLVRFVAESGGSVSSRNAIAMANVAATEQLDRLVGCLRTGSVSSTPYSIGEDAPTFKDVGSDQPVRVDGAYCSFFESRLINYEEALFSMLRQAARDDPDAKLLENMLTGSSVLDFASVVSTLVEIAGRVIRDAITLRAFTADAQELEYFVWRPYAIGPGQIYSECAEQPNAVCNDTSIATPERASIDALRSALATQNAKSVRPTILVWHFEEVEAFLVSACEALNGDELTVKKASGTNCSAELPFPLPAHGPTGGPISPQKPGASGSPGDQSSTGASNGAKPGPSPARAGLPGALGDAEKGLSAASLETIQATALCVRPTSEFDPATRLGVKILEDALSRPPPADRLSEGDLRLLGRAQAVNCPDGAENYFEVSQFFDGKDYKPGAVKQLKELLNRAETDNPVSYAGAGAVDKLEQVRDKVKAVRKLVKLADVVPPDSDQITRSFFNGLRKSFPPAVK